MRINKINKINKQIDSFILVDHDVNYTPRIHCVGELVGGMLTVTRIQSTIIWELQGREPERNIAARGERTLITRVKRLFRLA